MSAMNGRGRPANNVRPTRAGVRGLRCGLASAWLVATLSLAAPMAEAQEVPASLEALLQSGRLEAGDAVYVTDTHGRRVAGNVSGLSSSWLEIAAEHETVVVPESEVSEVELRDPVWNGIWWGVVGGLATYFVICPHGTDPAYTCMRHLGDVGLIFVGSGALLGWGSDVTIRETVYRKPGSARLTVSPVVTHDGAGAAMTLSW